MPHFGLMDESALGPVEGPLMRAKLHIRGGRRRLNQGKISLGIITLYDAMISAMQWYISDPSHEKMIKVKDKENMNDDRIAYKVLTRSGVLDGSFDYDSFNELADKALYQDLSAYDHRDMLRGVELVMTQLGIMPFDENDLPPEDPETV
jgi:hypothetical protein